MAGMKRYRAIKEGSRGGLGKGGNRRIKLTHEVISDGLYPGGDLSRVCVAHRYAVMTPFVLWSTYSVVENEIRRADGGRSGRRWRLFLLNGHPGDPIVPIAHGEHVAHW